MVGYMSNFWGQHSCINMFPEFSLGTESLLSTSPTKKLTIMNTNFCSHQFFFTAIVVDFSKDCPIVGIKSMFMIAHANYCEGSSDACTHVLHKEDKQHSPTVHV